MPQNSQMALLAPIKREVVSAEQEVRNLAIIIGGARRGKDGFWRSMKRILAPHYQPPVRVRTLALHKKLDRIDRELRLAHNQSRQDRALATPLRQLQNKTTALYYSAWLLSSAIANYSKLEPIDSQKIEPAVRYILDADLHDKQISGILEEILKKPFLLLLPIPLLSHEPILKKLLSRVREVALLSRPAGPRGDLAVSAVADPDKAEFLKSFREKFKTDGNIRNQIALLLGEWGGIEDSRILQERLHSLSASQGLSSLNPDDQVFAQDLISAITTIGGPQAVDTLVELAEMKGHNPLASIALSSLEYLSSAGSIALTEAPEPPTLSTPQLREEYRNLANRLRQLSRSHDVDKYVRYKADELLQTTIRPALKGSF